MKSTNYILASAALMLALGSCSESEEIYIEPVAATVTADINTAITRASGATWANEDAIGISTATADTKTTYTNKKYVTTDNGQTFSHDGGKETGIFFKDSKKVKFSAYYPFSGTEGTSAGTIEIDTRDQSKQGAFDFLYATSEEEADHDNPNIKFTFTHKMTKLTLQVKVEKESGFTEEALETISYSLGGLKHDGQFNTETGAVSLKEDAEAAGDWTLANGTTSSSDRGLDIYDMILCPQTNTGLQFKATVGTESFYCTLTPALAEGTSYTYNITVKKTGLTVSTCDINDWTTGTSGNVNAEMQ